MANVSVLSVLFSLVLIQVTSENYFVTGLQKTLVVNRPTNTDNVITETAERLKNELTAEYWIKNAQQTVQKHVTNFKQWKNAKKPKTARNGILVVGGGMSLTTIKAARVHRGLPKKEEAQLSFEKFPVLGISKTYCIDSQVGDDACTASAYLGGAKTFKGGVGTSDAGSIAQWALSSGKDIGIITTSSLTEPSMAGTYAKLNHPSWNGGEDITPGEEELAHQLLINYPVNNFKVILGGGRSYFLPNGTNEGIRSDKRNLIDEWIQNSTASSKREYITTKKQLQNVGSSTDYLLGLFAPGPLDYHLLRNTDSQPTLEEMAEAAIKVLSKSKNGYFLFVYGGRINDAHGENKAKLAIDETLQLSEAVEKINAIVTMQSKDDTLVVITANHGNTMTYSGYSTRWNNIFDKVDIWEDIVYDNIPYLTIQYANGPGFKKQDVSGVRIDETKDPLFNDSRYRFPATVPLQVGTSGGEDVAVFAKGPFSNLFSGNYEQHLLPHMMAYAMCIGRGDTACGKQTTSTNGAVTHLPFIISMCLMFAIIKMYEKCFTKL